MVRGLSIAWDQNLERFGGWGNVINVFVRQLGREGGLEA